METGLGRVLVTGGAGLAMFYQLSNVQIQTRQKWRNAVRLTPKFMKGCLGSHTVELLYEKRKELGVAEIVVLDVLKDVRWALPGDDARIKSYVDEWIVGSITDPSAVSKAIRGCKTVLHIASMVDTGAVPKDLIYNVNIKGTETILAACMMEPSVRVLVYSSTLDVSISHLDWADKIGVSENLPYSIDVPGLDVSHDVYCITKTLSEKRVLRANDPPRLRTCSVRPAGLYGERDSVHVGSVFQAAVKLGSGFIFRFGDGSAVFQHVYARNCAWLHIVCAKELCEGNDACAGEAFLSLDDTKVTNFFDFFEPYLAAKGYAIPWIRIPFPMIYPIACFVEDIFTLVKALAPSLVKNVDLKLTRRALHGTCVSQWFDTDKARRLTRYRPLFSPMEARQRTIEYFAKADFIFPQGPYKYEKGKYDYLDDGTDFRPDHPKYLTRERRKHEKNKTQSAVKWLLLLASTTAVAFDPFLKRYIRL